MSQSIWFDAADISFVLRQKSGIRKWIHSTVEAEDQQLASLNYIFCSDAYLLDINQRYLNHDTYTDIITFDYTEDQSISGEIYISVDRTRANGRKYGSGVTNELHRVIIHGVLHLLGYKDKTKAEALTMREKEEHYLSLRDF